MGTETERQAADLVEAASRALADVPDDENGTRGQTRYVLDVLASRLRAGRVIPTRGFRGVPQAPRFIEITR
jgi:hypothetical protein